MRTPLLAPVRSDVNKKARLGREECCQGGLFACYMRLWKGEENAMSFLYTITFATYSCSRNLMRLSVDGWVLNMLLNQLPMLSLVRAWGCMMKSCSTSSRPLLTV